MVRLFNCRCPGSLPRIAEIFVVFVICLALCLGCAVQPANAVGVGTTVSVAGGAVGTSGLGALGALGTLLGPTLGVVGVVLLGAGVNAYVTEASSEAGVTKTQFIETSMRNWVSERGGSFDDLITTLAEGIHVSPLGQISLTGAAGALIYQFGNWLFANDMVEDPPSVSGSENVSMGDFSLHTVSSGQSLQYFGGPYTTSSLSSFYWSDVQVSPLYAIILNFSANRPDVLCYIYPDTYTISYDSFRMYNQNGTRINVFGDGIGTSYNLGNGYKIVPDIYWKNCDIPAIPSYDISISQFVSAVTGLPLGSESALPSDDVFTGTEQDWTNNRDLLRPGEDNVVVVDNAPDLLGGVAENLSAGDYVVSVPDYLASIADLYNQALAAEASVPLALTDSATGVVVTDTVAVEAPFQDVAVTTSAVDTDATGALVAPAASVDAADAVTLMTPDLTLIFPFCIPFDIARVLTLLSAEPVIPRYHVSWDSQYLDDPIEFDIDLTPWDGVMSVLRTMETLLFVVGLALATRRIYLRG